MLHVGLDLSRRRLDFDLLCEDGSRIERDAVAPDADGLRRLVRRVAVYREPVRAAIESMNGARYVHDELERSGWEVEVADAQKVKGLAPLASKTDRIDAWVLAELSRRELVPAIWLPSFEQRGERERARWRLFLVRKRSSLKHRVHAQLLAFGHPLPGLGLVRARWPRAAGKARVSRAVALRRARGGGDGRGPRRADHRDRPRAERSRRRPPLYPAADERPWDRVGAGLHDRRRDRRHQPLPLAAEAVQLHGLVPARSPIWLKRPPRRAHTRRPEVPALGADGGCHQRLPGPDLYHDRYQRNKRRLGKQRGAKVAQVDLARCLAQAIWHMLTRNQTFAPAGARSPLAA